MTTVTEQIPTQTEPGYPSAYDLKVEKASLDNRVGLMAVRFMTGDLRFDEVVVQNIATEYDILPDDVTERACLQSIVRQLFDGVPDGEA